MKDIACIALAGLFFQCAQIAAAKEPTTPISLNLPAQPLRDALNSLARQTGLQVIYTADEVTAKLAAPPLEGRYTTESALNALLKNSGLTFEFLNAHTIAITVVGANKSAIAGAETRLLQAGDMNSSVLSTQPGGVGSDSSGSTRLAQANSNAQTQGQGTDDSTDQTKAAAGLKKVMLTEIVVTGSRIPLTAGQQSVQPVRSYTREDIAISGQSTVGEFLRTLPDVSTFAASSQQTVVGAQSVQLHGLPVGTTLSLLDGRRVEAGHVGFFDLSTIPVSAVERVEILPVGASAIYGADALGGAVNFILRKDFNGFEVNATLDHAVDVNDPSVNLAWGKAWSRGSISLIASYENRGELLGTQRAPTSLNHFPVDVPASAAVALLDDSCAPGNVYSLDGSNLPGLSSPAAGIPSGISGRPTIGQFAATAGKLNACNAGRYTDITPRSQREGALLSAHFWLTEYADLFTETLFSHRRTELESGPLISVSQFYGEPLSANNPYNPFGQDVNVSFVYPGIMDQEVQFDDLIRPVLGIRGSLFSDWHYEASGTFSRDRVHQVTPNADFTRVSAALASSDPATALNPFTSGAPGSPQLLSSLANSVDRLDSGIDDQLMSAQATLRGPIAHLPAGAAQVVMGGDWSHEKQSSINSGFPPSYLQRKSYALFGEARAPLLATGVIERLTLSVAGRYDHSNDYGGKATWQGGLVWRTTDTLSFSGSYGRSYQAPHLFQISGPQLTFAFPLAVSDPFRGNELSTYPVLQTFGPNYHLKPETGSSSTLRLEYTSQAIQGLHASLTWYDLAISHYIGFQSTQAVVANPMLFPGAVVRAPATPLDQQQGFLGVITQYNDTNYNFGNLRVKGYDADVSYALDTRIGQFTPSLALANIYQWTSALLPGTAAVDAVSRATYLGVGWAPRWKGTVSLAWKEGPLSMNVAGRYISRYLDYQDYVPNTNEIGNSWVLDAGARFDVGEEFVGAHPALAHAYIALSAVNLLNKTPPFANTPYWYDIQQYDIRGPFLHLSVGIRL